MREREWCATGHIIFSKPEHLAIKLSRSDFRVPIAKILIFGI